MASEKWLIDAAPLAKNGWHLVKTGGSNRFLAQMSLVDVPAADAVEVVNGRWEEWTGSLLKCSVCGYEYTDYLECHNYCGNCGAKMDGGN